MPRREHYKTGGGKGGPYRGGKGPVMFNIRVRYLRHRDEPKPRTREVIDALQTLLDTGEMPERWQFMAIDWQNPKRATGWRRGFGAHAEEALDKLAPAIQAEIHNLTVTPARRVGEVERDER